MTNGNGWKGWAMGALFAVAMAMTGALFTGLSTRVDKIEDKTQIHAQRQAALDVVISQMAETLRKLDGKVDQILEGRRRDR